jgi:hypothetical protein
MVVVCYVVDVSMIGMQDINGIFVGSAISCETMRELDAEIMPIAKAMVSTILKKPVTVRVTVLGSACLGLVASSPLGGCRSDMTKKTPFTQPIRQSSSG